MEYDPKKIGERIRKERQEYLDRILAQGELDYKFIPSQEEFIKILNEKGYTLSRKTLIKWEKGRAIPDLNWMKIFCELFDCEVGYLLCEYNEKHRGSKRIHKRTGLSIEAVDNIIESAIEKESAPEKLSLMNNGRIKPEDVPKEFYLVDIISALASDYNVSFIEYIKDTLQMKRDFEEIKKHKYYALFEDTFKRAKATTKSWVNYNEDKEIVQNRAIRRRENVFTQYDTYLEDYLKVLAPDLKNPTEKGFDILAFKEERPFSLTAQRDAFNALWAEDTKELETRYSTIASMFRDIVKGLE